MKFAKSGAKLLHFLESTKFFLYFCIEKMDRTIKILNRLLGLPLVYAGVAVLMLSYVTGLARHNAVLLTGLFLIVAGVVSYVWLLKRPADKTEHTEEQQKKGEERL